MMSNVEEDFRRQWVAACRAEGMSEEQIAATPSPLHADPYVPKALAASWEVWKENPQASWHIRCYRRGNLRVTFSVASYLGKRWMHVCCSRPDSVPSHKELREVKLQFIGNDREAIQKFPKESEYVNFAVNALHLWHCLDGDTTPDFRVLGMI